MLFRYEPLDPEFLRDINLQKLTKLFLELLMKASGNLDTALRWMQGIWDRNQLERATGMSFDEFRDHLEDEGLLERNTLTGGLVPAPKAGREIQRSAFEEIFADLKRDAAGNHPVHRPGGSGEKQPETRPFEFGDAIEDVNFVQSISNSLLRTGIDSFGMEEGDLATHERENLSSCATVILIDISHSMILYGEDRITPAKKVAMALAEYIQTRYPKDAIDVAVFGDDAQEIAVDKIASISVGPFHTNTKAGLQAALRILQRRKHANKQVFMITDGKPSAIWENGELYKNPYGLDPKIAAQTINEAVNLRRKGVTVTTFMITTDPYLQDFVDELTRANKGRAFYSTLDNLGKFLFADYARNKKKKV